MQRGRKALLLSKVPLDGRRGVEAAVDDQGIEAAPDDWRTSQRTAKSGVPIRISQRVEDLRRRRRQPVSRAQGSQRRHRGGRVHLGRRAVRLRQEHADADGGGAAEAQPWRHRGGGKSRNKADHRRRHRLPGPPAPRVPHCACDNVTLQADIRGLPRKKIEARAKELFAAASADARDAQVSASAFRRHAPARFARFARWCTTRRCS